MGKTSKPPDEARLQIFDRVSDEETDILKVVLLECAERSHITEIYEVFGREYFLKFIDIFAGATITCPSRAVLEEAIRNVSIYLLISSAKLGSRAQLVRDLAAKYDLTTGYVRELYFDMGEKLSRYDMKREDKR